MRWWRYLCYIQFYILLVIYTFLGLVSTPENYVPMFNDKLMHASGYLVAAFSISLAYPYKPYWIRALSLIVFSMGIEIGQYFSPPRTCDWQDVIANSIGVISGLLLLHLLRKTQPWFWHLFTLGHPQTLRTDANTPV